MSVPCSQPALCPPWLHFPAFWSPRFIRGAPGARERCKWRRWRDYNSQDAPRSAARWRHHCAREPVRRRDRPGERPEPGDSPGRTDRTELGQTGPEPRGAMAQDRQEPPAKRFKAAPPGTQPQSAAPPAHVQRRSLPISGARGPLLARLRHLDTAVLIGETGSGKTTQLPQFLYEAGIGQPGVIAVTQPRRVAAVTLAARVAEEKRTELGKLVGYTVRFDDCSCAQTRLRFLTDGMLLREAIGDPLLHKYSVAILDEAHERTIHTDVLFGVVKAAQKKRKERGLRPLKVIVMSATMDVDLFSQYFNGAPVIYLEGRQHPIDIFYTKERQNDYLQAALVSIFQIHQEAPACQDILVFLTGQEEIEAMTKTCRDVAQHLPEGCPRMTVLPLYASLPHSQQLRAFKPTPEGCRKVILSTNIAETSITIAGIKFVVDTGMVKAKKYSPETGLEVLAVQQVSKAQAWQRTGRAGRQESGICYRLYTEEDFEKFEEMTTPEIQRCNLASVVLQLLALKIPNVLTFDFMSKPSPDALQAAIDQLDLLGAVTQKEGQVVLTPLGKKMAAFPLDPKFSKAILLSPQFHCAEEILTIVSLLSVDSVLHNPPAQREEVQAVRKKFISSEGDHLTLLNVYRAYKSVNGHKGWCRENFINGRNMKLMAEVRAQLRDICVKLSVPLESCRGDTAGVRRCLAHSLFMNAAQLRPDGSYSTVGSQQAVAIHPSSVLFQCKPACVVFTGLLRTSRCYMRDLCPVDAEWLLEAAPEYFHRRLRTAKS